MTQPIEVTFLATVQTVITLESPDASSDGSGFFLELKKGSTEAVQLRLKAKDGASLDVITGVRSVPTPDGGQGPWTQWILENGLFVRPDPLVLGTSIRLEVDNSANVATVPQGGGHFRVVEEGGSFVLLAAPSAPDSPDQRVRP